MSQNFSKLETYLQLTLTNYEQEQLINISSDVSLNDMFDSDKLPQSWMLVKNNYPSLSDKAVKVLLPSVTT
jgi:hypothetical protein